MVPIKDFLVYNLYIYIRNEKDIVALSCVANNEYQVEWLVKSLSEHFDKPYQFVAMKPGNILTDEQIEAMKR